MKCLVSFQFFSHILHFIQVNALLGEMSSVGGQVLWANDVTVAYAAQKPWLLNNTVKNNILFGQPFIRERYESILEACALKNDLEILPAGKCAEEIIPKGVSGEGGDGSGDLEVGIVSCDKVVVAGTLRIVMMFGGNIGIVGG